MEYMIASEKDLELVMASRLEMLKVVNDLPEDYVFDREFVKASREYFQHADQTTILAVDTGAADTGAADKDAADTVAADTVAGGGRVVGCATMCYIEIMPTFSHPTGKRAHLMNVYTNKRYRRQGIAQKMVTMLIQEAKERGVTEISLDATEEGRPLYERLGFKASEECMVL